MADTNERLQDYQDSIEVLSREDFFKEMGESADYIWKNRKPSCKEDTFYCGV